MIFIKSILAGVLCLVAVGFLALVIAIVGFALFASRHAGEAVAFDPVSIARNSSLYLWALPALIFSLGFAWEYRRVKSRQAK